MNAIDHALREFRSLEELAANDNPLTRIDARAKLIVTLVFILVVVSYDRYQIAAILPLALFPAAVAILGEVPLAPLARKLALALPFAVMVGLFNPWFDTDIIVRLGDLSVSAGWVSFVSILVRCLLSVSAALLLLATTGMNSIAGALAALGAPRVFTSQLLFLYRYSFVLGGEASRMLTAAQLRAAGRPRLEFRTWVSLMGQLLLRAFERAQRIHLAMLARGFDGELRAVHRPRWTRVDTAFTFLCCLGFVFVRAVDWPQRLGQLLLSLTA